VIGGPVAPSTTEQINGLQGGNAEKVCHGLFSDAGKSLCMEVLKKLSNDGARKPTFKEIAVEWATCVDAKVAAAVDEADRDAVRKMYGYLTTKLARVHHDKLNLRRIQMANIATKKDAIIEIYHSRKERVIDDTVDHAPELALQVAPERIDSTTAVPMYSASALDVTKGRRETPDPSRTCYLCLLFGFTDTDGHVKELPLADCLKCDENVLVGHAQAKPTDGHAKNLKGKGYMCLRNPTPTTEQTKAPKTRFNTDRQSSRRKQKSKTPTAKF
jgi:hypothetical protein